MKSTQGTIQISSESLDGMAMKRELNRWLEVEEDHYYGYDVKPFKQFSRRGSSPSDSEGDGVARSGYSPEDSSVWSPEELPECAGRESLDPLD